MQVKQWKLMNEKKEYTKTIFYTIWIGGFDEMEQMIVYWSLSLFFSLSLSFNIYLFISKSVAERSNISHIQLNFHDLKP